MLPSHHTDPFDLFTALSDRVRESAPAGFDPDTFALATADREARPSVRIVLVREVARDGLVFYTNYESRKAAELEANPRAALCGFWHWLKQQVRVEGRVVRAAPGQSDAYFASRPRGNQLGAWASPQSAVIGGRADLEARVQEVDARFRGQVVPRPDFWGGYRLVPDRFEFWTERPDRLHERLAFTAGPGGWDRMVLAP